MEIPTGLVPVNVFVYFDPEAIAGRHDDVVLFLGADRDIWIIDRRAATRLALGEQEQGYIPRSVVSCPAEAYFKEGTGGQPNAIVLNEAEPSDSRARLTIFHMPIAEAIDYARNPHVLFEANGGPKQYYAALTDVDHILVRTQGRVAIYLSDIGKIDPYIPIETTDEYGEP